MPSVLRLNHSRSKSGPSDLEVPAGGRTNFCGLLLTRSGGFAPPVAWAMVSNQARR